jgi:hypothetical protein
VVFNQESSAPYILEGSVTLEHEGEPAKQLKAGDAFENEPGVHNAKNTGKTPVKILAVYLVEKGKPIAEPIPWVAPLESAPERRRDHATFEVQIPRIIAQPPEPRHSRPAPLVTHRRHSFGIPIRSSKC